MLNVKTRPVAESYTDVLDDQLYEVLNRVNCSGELTIKGLIFLHTMYLSFSFLNPFFFPSFFFFLFFSPKERNHNS